MFGLSCSYLILGLLILLTILWRISDEAKYRIKFTVFLLASALFASWSIPFMLLKPGDWRNALLPAWQLRKLATLMGINFIVRGRENIVKETGAIVLINHQSSIDLMVLAELWPVLERGTVISKKIILFAGTFGLASWLWGTIFIDRSNMKDAQDKVNSTAAIINKRKAKVMIFPEGTRNDDDILLPFKKGAFHVAIASQVPIQPVVVSKYHFLDHKLKSFSSGTAYINILPAISTNGLKKEDLQSLMDQTYQIMNDKFQETSQQSLELHENHLKSQ